ncbi:MAG TPA: methyltransferase domain-containing protein [Ignavibacteriales bacterium]|nr:methyltransferase domain-containing protein [Ignavibacteriales bacterium]
MKARESGMPDEEMWERFFNPEKIFTELEIDGSVETLVEFGFGYGTFTIPAAKRIGGRLLAYDIEQDLFQKLEAKLKLNNINNVSLYNKDFISGGTGLQDDASNYIMLFNILHAEESPKILYEAYRILKKNGKVGVIHWNYDPATPRGPSMSIRPKPEDIKQMLLASGFTILKYNINLPPYHYGILAQKHEGGN